MTLYVTIGLPRSGKISAKRRQEWETRYPGAIEWKVIGASPDECSQRAEAENDWEIQPIMQPMEGRRQVPGRQLAAMG